MIIENQHVGDPRIHTCVGIRVYFFSLHYSDLWIGYGLRGSTKSEHRGDRTEIFGAAFWLPNLRQRGGGINHSFDLGTCLLAVFCLQNNELHFQFLVMHVMWAAVRCIIRLVTCSIVTLEMQFKS